MVSHLANSKAVIVLGSPNVDGVVFLVVTTLGGPGYGGGGGVEWWEP